FGKTNAGASTSPAPEQLSISTGGGGLAVVEQQKLELAISTRAPRVGTIVAPEPGIVRTAAQLDELVAKLSKQQVIAVELLKDSLDACQGCIVGYAFAWSSQAKLNE